MFPLEGDRAAYFESSQATIIKNTESIRKLRQENKKLYKKLAEANAVSLNLIQATSPSLLLNFVLMYLQSKDHAVLSPIHFWCVLRVMKASSRWPFIIEASRRTPIATCQGR